MAGLYIHIPFCESRCIYCGFYSTTSLKLRDAYVGALCREMALRPIPHELPPGEAIRTIYLGGGTPSQLSGEQLAQLFEGIKKYVGESWEESAKEGSTLAIEQRMREELEVTMECNPDDITPDFCETLQRLPINRISMGAQTFSDERLRFLHRRHNAQEVRQAVERLRGVGIKNISIDLMFGFPGETIEEWTKDIRQALLLDVEHISAYSLMYEEGTSLYRMMEQGKIRETDEETSRMMYEKLINLLTHAGYEHYEISNFAKPHCQSRHNSSYWHETPYIGIGAAAHSYRRNVSIPPSPHDEVTRSWNVDDIRAYIHAINQGTLPCEQETLDITTRYNDLITTALRTREGIDIQRMKAEYGAKMAQGMLDEARRHIDLGLMKISQGKLSLTHKGLYISDDIMSDFMIV